MPFIFLALLQKMVGKTSKIQVGAFMKFHFYKKSHQSGGQLSLFRNARAYRVRSSYQLSVISCQLSVFGNKATTGIRYNKG